MAQEKPQSDFNWGDGHNYALDRSHLAACRLNLQHFLWRDTLKFTIHPSISLPQRPIIADVATGTAIWMFDVLREHQNAQIDGLDIDLSQAPHPKKLPSNVKLREWSIFDDVPEDMVGKYDYVHIRLLILVLKISDIQPVIQKFFKLLKPGGYLQWDELDCFNMHVKRVEPSMQSPALDGIRTLCYADGRYNWSVEIPQKVTQEGFENATIDYYDDDPHLQRAFNDQHTMTMEELAVGLIKNGKQDDAANLFKLIKGAYSESVRGATLCLPRVVCVARKPI